MNNRCKDWNRTRAGRTYNVVAWLLLAAVAVQVFLAGYALLVDAAAWRLHVAFVPVVELLPLALAGVAGFSRAPRRFLWLGLGAFGLVWLQYLLIHVPVDWLRPLHPTNALALTIVAWTAARTSLAESP